MTEFEQMQLEQLKRIADVLEDINSALTGMSAPIESLAECVDEALPTEYTPGYTFLRVGGSVDTRI